MLATHYLKFFGSQARNNLLRYHFTFLSPPLPFPPSPFLPPSPSFSLPPCPSSHLLGLLDRLCFGDEDGEGRGELEGEEPSLDLSPPSFGLPCLLLPRPLFEMSIAAALGLADFTLGDRSTVTW